MLFVIYICLLRHGKRTTINGDDVKLLVRRNEDLVSILKVINIVRSQLSPLDWLQKATLESLRSSNSEDSAKTDRGKALVNKKKTNETVPPEVTLDTDDDDMFTWANYDLSFIVLHREDSRLSFCAFGRIVWYANIKNN